MQNDDPPGRGTPRHTGLPLPDPVLVSRTMADVAERGQRLVAEFLRRQQAGFSGAARTGSAQTGEAGAADPMRIGGAFLEMTARLMGQPTRMMQAQIGFWQDYLTLWGNTARRMMGGTPEPVIAEDPRDERFRAEAWRENEVFDFVKQSYLLSARYLQTMARGAGMGLTPRAAQRIDFYTSQFVDALSPSHFLLTNPEVLRRTAETGGENLLKGLSNLLRDLERGRAGAEDAGGGGAAEFRLGETIGATPGKVVFQNALMQLIQYEPTTERTLRRPLLILPPWINKFYVLDLRPRNSFVRWAVSQGHTVFVCSWVDPDAALAERDFADDRREGPLAALDAIGTATGERAVNALGYGLGGTLLAATMAWMAARGDDRIRSATYLATMVDFEEAGELGVFIDESQIAALEEPAGANDPAPPGGRDLSRQDRRESSPADGKGLRPQDGSELLQPDGETAPQDGAESSPSGGKALSPPGGGGMAAAFHTLRANDLIWSFVVQNYLLGQEPFPFDLLHWNADSTRMPSRMHAFYLRHMYQRNELARPGALVLDGVPIDLGRIEAPSYVLAAREDHIAPWRSAYRATRLFGGPVRFVLAASGHVAGVVNPPEAGRYSFWTNPDLPAAPQAWEDGAIELSGSWWPDWQRWVRARGDAEVPARRPGAGPLPPIEDAPGSYVRVSEAA